MELDTERLGVGLGSHIVSLGRRGWHRAPWVGLAGGGSAYGLTATNYDYRVRARPQALFGLYREQSQPRALCRHPLKSVYGGDQAVPTCST